MSLPNLTLTELQRLEGQRAETVDTLHMDHDAFQGFYQQTARPVWVFLFRRTGDEQLADDLLQDTYYRFLRTHRDFENESHRRNYLFRIARNVANDALRWRRDRSCAPLPEDGPGEPAAGGNVAAQSENRTDLIRAMATLSLRQRDALWLAYAEGSSHQEIAEVLGLKTASIKLLLFRARRKLAGILQAGRGEAGR